MVLNDAACRLGDLGEVDDVSGVPGVDRVVPRHQQKQLHTAVHQNF